MTQEDKQLLLKDLSARLPYGIKVAIEYSEGKYTRIYDLREIDNDVTSELRQRVIVWNYGIYSSVISYPLIDCRPYLRPMSSMTEVEKKEYHNLCYEEERECYEFGEWVTRVYYHDTIESIDWLNAHHFDYRGLIPKGLAIEAPNDMYEH